MAGHGDGPAGRAVVTAWLIGESGPAAWATAGTAAVAFALSWRLMRRLTPLTSRRTVHALLVLRGLALLLLAMTPFEPSVQSLDSGQAARPLRVVLDDSLSMAGVDAGRSRAESLQIAAALGDPAARRPDAPDRARVDAIGDLRTAGERLAAARSANQDVDLRRADVDRSRRAAQDAVHAFDSRSLGTEAAAAFDAVGRRVDESADAAAVRAAFDGFRVALRRESATADDRFAAAGPAAAAASRVRAMSRYDLGVAAVVRLTREWPAGVVVTDLDGHPVDVARPASPSAEATPLTLALRDACVHAAADRSDAVVLLSDGRSTEPRSLLAPAVTATGVPVFTVAVAAEDKSPDVRLAGVDARPVVLAGQDVPVRLRLTQRNAAGLNARVTLSDGERSVDRIITLANENAFEMTWPDARPPRLRLTARVEAVAGEMRLQNNALTTDVSVVERRARVLMIGGDGPDVTALADAMKTAAWVSLTRRTPGIGPAVTTAEVADADVIVLADVPGDGLTTENWDAIRRAVRDRGASLLALPGRGDWLADPRVARSLAGLLPTASGPRPAWFRPAAEPEVWPVPTAAGGEAAWLRLDETGEASLRQWLARPRLSRVLSAGPAAAGAVVLLVDRTTQAPVLVGAAAGRGRTMMLLVDEVWRWPEPDDAQRTGFWPGLVGSLVDLPYDHASGGLSLSLDREAAAAGQAVGIRVFVADPNAGPVSLSVARPRDGGGDTPRLRERLPGSGRYTASVTRPTGVYDVTVRQRDVTVRATLTVLPDTRPETADLSPDIGNLRRIADATGGAFIPIEDLDELPRRLSAYSAAHPRPHTFELWCSPWWFAAIVACLGAEWAVRVEAGLV